jgi:hypothetical protein
VADAGNYEIRAVNTANGTLSTLAGVPDNGSTDGIGTLARFNWPSGVAVVPAAVTATAGYLIVADSQNNEIREVPITTPNPPATALTTTTLAGMAGTPAAEPAGFDSPTGLAVDNAGHVYVADESNNVIGLVINGTIQATPYAGAGYGTASVTPVSTAAATFHSPSRVAVDNNTANTSTFGNVYVADTGNNAIRAIYGGNVYTIGTSPTFNQPLGIAVDLAGNIYVANTNNNNIQEISADFSTTSPVAGDAGGSSGSTDGINAKFNNPWGVAVDNSTLASAGTIYVADSGNNTIRMISGGSVTTIAGSATAPAGFNDGTGLTALFDHPDQLVVDTATGYLYVADTFNHAIRMIVPGTSAATTTVVTLVGTGTVGILPTSFPVAVPATLAFPFGIALDPLTQEMLFAVHDAILTSPY